MARNFSTNQVRQLYVAGDYAEKVDDKSAKQAITLKSSDNGIDKELYFVYKGADTVLKSDFIPVKNITYIKATKKEDLRRPFTSKLVVLSKDVNGGNPVVGQDYILRIAFKQFYGMSEEDQYFKDAAVHVTSSISTPEKFYQAMADSLNIAFARELNSKVTVKHNADGTTTVTGSNPYLTFTPSKDGLTITEKEQPWSRGIEQRETVNFDVVPTTIYVDDEDVVWGITTNKTDSKSKVTPGVNGVGNGKDIADLEYFCMGERGDQYRMVGFPNYVPTEYLVNPDAEYNTLDIHFAYTGDGVNSYRSEKDITIVAEKAETINDIVKAINEAAGLKIKDLGGAADSAAGGTTSGGATITNP